MNAPPSAASTVLQRAFAPSGVLRASVSLGNVLLARRHTDDQAVEVSVADARRRRLRLYALPVDRERPGGYHSLRSV